jgi:hypothetical protein
MLGAISQALSGINAGFDRLNHAAVQVARDGADGDLAGNMVELIKAPLEVRVNLAALRTANETIGSIINVLA